LASGEAAARRIIAEADHLKRAFGLPRATSDKRDDAMAGLLLGFAYPDRIGMKRKGGHAASAGGSGALAENGGAYTLSNGRGAVLPRLQPLSAGAFLAAADLEDTGTDSRIRLAAAFDASWFEAHYADRVETERAVRWDRQAGAVRARMIERFGALVLRETVLQSPDPE